jgi:N-acetyl-1-D-myo-inositol-2-amino-2-deoxy-alpha-D-glucopyranoside deacetylase
VNGRAGSHRLLLVHAHPDDESIGTGATIARYAAEGAQVTLVTCTLGELGEVIPPDLAHLAGAGERLGAHRITELAAACAALGVGDQRFLGGPGRWRDSGMMGLPSNDNPACFWQADVDTAAAELARILREVRPQVLVTYDEHGFYGHPDHIQAHRVARRAIRLAVDPGLTTAPGRGAGPWQVAKLYATAVPRSVAAAEGLPFWVPDNQVTTEIDGGAYLAAKTAALRAHATQIAVDGDCFALADGRRQPVLGREFYTLLAWGGTPLPRGRAPGPQGPGTPRGADGAWPASRQAPSRELAWGGDPSGTPRGADGAWPASRQAPSRELAGAANPPGGPGTMERDLFAGLEAY